MIPRKIDLGHSSPKINILQLFTHSHVIPTCMHSIFFLQKRCFEERLSPNNIDFFIVWTKGFTDVSQVMFERTWGWVNDDRIFISTIHLPLQNTSDTLQNCFINVNKEMACLMGTHMWLKGRVGYFYGIFLKGFLVSPRRGVHRSLSTDTSRCVSVFSQWCWTDGIQTLEYLT